MLYILSKHFIKKKSTLTKIINKAVLLYRKLYLFLLRRDTCINGHSPKIKSSSVIFQYTVLTIILLASYSSLAQLSNTTRNYSERNAINLVGDYDVIGNTNMQCLGCAGGTQTNNPPANMVYIDIDGDATTVNSSSATFTLPAGATVEWAGLYWGGVYSSTFAGITNPVGMNNDQVKFKEPGAAGYTVINATTRNLDTGSFAGWNTFLSFAEVTSIVQSAGSGNYSVADINLATGTAFTGPHGGWTMVVIYSDPTDLSRRINVWDGFQFFGFGSSDSFTVTGVLTPTLGAFETKVAYYGMDGEASHTGDFININGSALSNALNPVNNIYNGTVSVFGVNNASRNPNITGYNWGYDLDIFNAAGLVPNSATTIGVQLGSTNEGIWGGVFVISNEIVLPTLSKSFSNTRINRIGDPTTVTLVLDNPNKGISMTNASITDNLPSGLVIAPAPNASISCGGTITAVAGTSSFTASGMNIPVNTSCTITFDVVATQLGILVNTISNNEFSNDQGVDLQNSASAIIKVGEDTDGDGIIDILDLDDDNDGITDTQELCGTDPLPAVAGSSTITINIDLDQDENETSWTLVDPSGTTIGSGGTYLNADELISQSFTVSTTGNYTFTIFDSFGDGLARTGGSNSNGFANYSIAVDGTNVFTSANNPNFGSVSIHTFGVSVPYANVFSCLTSDPSNDDDGDGLFNYEDADYAIANGSTLNANGAVSSLDADGDGIINSLDLDADNDGIYDIIESGAINVAGVADSNNDGIIDGANVSAAIGANGLFNLIETASESGILNYTIAESVDDTDTIPNFLDLDSDGDGIPDNVEAQTTLGYTPPSGNDTDNNGVDDAYDTNGSPITPTNTDGADNPDYLDTDSDNEGANDTTEAGITLSGNDIDNDGLDDVTDADTTSYSDPGGIIDNPLASPVFLPDLDLDANSGGDVDFRDATDNRVDSDNDGIVDEIDLDDDNDGIPDALEACVSNNFSNGNGGGTHVFNYNDVVEAEINLSTVDNSFQVDVDGTTIHSNILQLESGNFSPGDVQMVFQSNGSQIVSPWVANTNGLPRIKIAIDQAGAVIIRGSRTTTSTTLEVMVTSDGSPFNTINFPVGATTITIINPNDGGPDGILGVINVQCDTDGDGIVNRLDLDSDNDGIYDIVEGGALAQAGVNDANNDGIIDGAPATFGSNGLFNTIEDNDTVAAALTFVIAESTDDTDTIPNFLDLDSDGDGIPDNVEAQTTLGYTPPSGNDTDNNGVDDAYDTNGSPITPTNTDGVDNPDYLDTDSDNEAGNDTTEAGITLSGNDIDNDGLDDVTDANTTGYSDPGGTIDDPLTGAVILPDTDGDANSGGDVDFRDAQSEADLSLTKTVDNASPNQGDTITFTLTISNAGPFAPTNLQVEDDLPVGVTFLSATPATGTAIFNAGTRQLVWSLGGFVLSAAPGSNTIAVTYTVRVDNCGEFTNRAEITSSSFPDPDSTVNSGN